MCIGLVWGPVTCWLGWALLVLLWPDSLRDAIFPAPEWVYDPARHRLRWVLVCVVGVLFTASATPLVWVVFTFFQEAPPFGLMITGVAVAGASLAQRDKPTRGAKSSTWLPTTGRWQRLFLFLAGLSLAVFGGWLGAIWH